jgi:sirohydrochlorin cobaltochelatase
VTAEAIVLLAHGSPDPDWLAPATAAAARLQALTPAPVRVATLEHGPTLADLTAELAALGLRRIAVIPLFLSPGGRHIKRDVPALVAAVQARFPALTLRLSPGAIGTDEPVLAALAAAALRRAADLDLS